MYELHQSLIHPYNYLLVIMYPKALLNYYSSIVFSLLLKKQCNMSQSSLTFELKVKMYSVFYEFLSISQRPFIFSS